MQEQNIYIIIVIIITSVKWKLKNIIVAFGSKILIFHIQMLNALGFFNCKVLETRYF